MHAMSNLARKGAHRGGQEVDGDEAVCNVRPLLCDALGRPDVALADLRHACVE